MLRQVHAIPLLIDEGVYADHPRKFRSCWTEVRQISTRCSQFIAAANAPIAIAIDQVVSEYHCDK